ncbi:universal stress protein [Streptomyces sp. NPDC048507]|uniref:universal stress protein n=1 Tax=Streptomyces sp. NPDC048507 TaxID=3365560 RepID=UPI00371FC9B9
MRRRVVVGVSGGTGSPTALHRAAAEARARRAQLWVVLAWRAPGGAPGSRTAWADALYPGYRAAAVERLRQALDRAVGAAGPGVDLRGQAVRGTPGAVLVDAVRDGDDLLVVGAGTRRGPLGPLRPSVARYCLAHAPCPVLTVPPGPLRAPLDAVRRRGTWHLPPDARELTE